MKLALHPALDPVMQELRQTLPQGLLLAGEPGVGLGTLAREIAGQHLVKILTPTDKDSVLDPVNGSISITEIRALYASTRGKSQVEQVIIIDDADKMTRGAQNAFLKLLEEPPASVHFILTAHSIQPLLPTIRSRVQLIHVPPISHGQSLQLISSADHQAQLLFIAEGRPAELTRLMSDSAYFDTESTRFSTAKSFLAASPYERLVIVSGLTTRLEATKFIDTVTVVARASLAAAPRQETIRLLEVLLTARDKIMMNGSLKLQLLRAVV